MTVRIIPRLDIKGPNLVKGIHLEGLRVLGRPDKFARFYYEAGADELFFQDTVASLYNRNSLLEAIERTSREVFIPLCVGGGLRTLDDIRAVLRAGADKVALNTAVIAQPNLIREAARAFGSSTIVVALEVITQADGSYKCFTNCGREETGVEALAWAQQAVELGAGELLVTSVNREGTGKGFDLDLVRKISDAVPVSVIAHGGAGSVDDVAAVVTDGHADAVVLASLLHYHAVRSIEHSPADFHTEGNLEFLLNHAARGFSKVKDTGLPELKAFLRQRDIALREGE